jgi:hypothetical protein
MGRRHIYSTGQSPDPDAGLRLLLMPIQVQPVVARNSAQDRSPNSTFARCSTEARLNTAVVPHELDKSLRMILTQLGICIEIDRECDTGQTSITGKDVGNFILND